MATKSGALALTTSLATVAQCGAGAEVVVFGLVFVNTTAATRTITLRVYQAAAGTPVDVPFTLGAGLDKTWGKPIALQPGDYISAKGDATGVTVVFSLDEDTGSTPVAQGFTPRGVYAAGSTYAVNDVVTDGAASYISLVAANQGNTPSSSPTKWMLLAAQGAQGPAGANGTTLTKGTGADIRAGADDAKYLTSKSLYDASLFVPLADAATIAVDMSNFLNAKVTLGGNRTLANPTNVKEGQSGLIRITQDATGSRTLAFGSAWKFSGGAPSLTTTAGAVDLIAYVVVDAATPVINCTISKAVA
ncbi:hypothetical protein [Caulobacter segnis]|uniref:Uncharacterized protein n=1 Tax=Caulobacter segnis TaxID=88688 RepID=A0A2W5V7I5_9CAUL|nr:hypothetical protein [Caulobacter segnis]PZR35780.1 MAG: hypothetical protein DI526_05690 [Caulobacter segnis]